MSLVKVSKQVVATFGEPIAAKDVAVLVQVVRTTDANARAVHAHTLSRGFVRGGGKKPWKQKGTGRARVSSIRSPLWRGGGIIFGPKQNRNFKLSLPQSLRTKALSIAFRAKAHDNAIWLTDQLPTDGKTKSMQQLVATEGLGKRILIVLPEPMPIVTRAGRNIPLVVVRQAAQLTTKEVLAAESIILTQQALDALNTRLSLGATA